MGGQANSNQLQSLVLNIRLESFLNIFVYNIIILLLLL